MSDDGEDEAPYPIPEGAAVFLKVLGLSLLVLLAVGVSLGVLALLDGDDGTDRPGPRGGATEITSPRPTVKYRVAGGLTYGSITVKTPDGTSQQDADFPLKSKAGAPGLTFEGFSRGDFLYISAQITDPDYRGEIRCSIVVGGDTVAEVVAVGFPSIATCEGHA